MSLYQDKEAGFAQAFQDLNSDSDEEDSLPIERTPPKPIKPDLPSPPKAQPQPTTRLPRKAKQLAIIKQQTSQEKTRQQARQSKSKANQNKPTQPAIITISDDDDEPAFVDQRLNDSVIVLDESTGDPDLSIEPVPVAEVSFDDQDIDYSFNLKIMLSGVYRQFSTTYKTPLNEALKDMISQLKACSKSLILTLHDGNPISLNESPHSLKLTPGNILNAIEVLNKSSCDESEHLDPDSFTIKLQDGHRKHLKEYRVSKQDQLSRLKKAYAEEFCIQLEKMKLFFDGDLVDDESTLEELDMDDGCVIDVMVSSRTIE